MAWNSCEDEAMARINDHLDVSNCYVRWGFVMVVACSIFPKEGMTRVQTKWITRQNVTRVILYGQQHVLNNLRLAMVKEAMGIGPAH